MINPSAGFCLLPNEARLFLEESMKKIVFLSSSCYWFENYFHVSCKHVIFTVAWKSKANLERIAQSFFKFRIFQDKKIYR